MIRAKLLSLLYGHGFLASDVAILANSEPLVVRAALAIRVLNDDIRFHIAQTLIARQLEAFVACASTFTR